MHEYKIYFSFFFSTISVLSGTVASDSILSISADIETIGEILKKIIPTLEEVCILTCSFLRGMRLAFKMIILDDLLLTLIHEIRK